MVYEQVARTGLRFTSAAILSSVLSVWLSQFGTLSPAYSRQLAANVAYYSWLMWFTAVCLPLTSLSIKVRNLLEEDRKEKLHMSSSQELELQQDPHKVSGTKSQLAPVVPAIEKITPLNPLIFNHML